MAAAAIALGGLALCALPVLTILLSLIFGGLGAENSLGGLYASLWPLVYAGLSASTAWYSLKGIRVN
jgi:hypothetical protein